MSKTNVDLDKLIITLYSNTPSSAIAIDKFSIASLESISLEKLKRLPNLTNSVMGCDRHLDYMF